MTAKDHRTDFKWGHIIRVPHTALCNHSLRPEYGQFYGVVISSQKLWAVHSKYENRLKKEADADRKEKITRKKMVIIERNRNRQRCEPHTQPSLGSAQDLKSTNITGGQYVVALLSREEIYPGFELQIESEERFRGWYVTAGLFVTVLESQLRASPESNHCWGRLSLNERNELRKYLQDLIENDWREEGEPKGCFGRILPWPAKRN